MMGVLFAVALSLSACAKKDDGASIRDAGRNGGGGNITQTMTTCTASQSTTGKIFDPIGSSSF